MEIYKIATKLEKAVANQQISNIGLGEQILPMLFTSEARKDESGNSVTPLTSEQLRRLYNIVINHSFPDGVRTILTHFGPITNMPLDLLLAMEQRFEGYPSYMYGHYQNPTYLRYLCKLNNIDSALPIDWLIYLFAPDNILEMIIRNRKMYKVSDR